MANDSLSAIVAVNQLPIKIVVVGNGSTIKSLATHTRNSQSATAMFFLLFTYYSTILLFILLVRSIAQHDEHVVFLCSREYTS